ncbi:MULTISPECIES: glycine cleavage system protein GcvH [Bacillus]|uniref:glycine cleavage system protein GcvH n=1 Tax=Bacillus TaxID=1386 RepID=UPI0022825F30|nr:MULTISPECIES: glycine cleavage system protein GcvH [Bacillus]MCY7621927.1 glycine cleavage system protein GcvH [Bacillus altitudinis]MDL2028724.1 glycine cleavage system protein GcvH [Bacillus subtilis]
MYYSKEHLWVKVDVDNNIVTLGITDYAQSTLGEIVFLELPEMGTSTVKGTSFGSIESVKTTSELFSPINGQIIEVNTELEDSPEFVNESPYDKGWLLKVKVSNTEEIKELLNAEEYDNYVSQT